MRQYKIILPEFRTLAGQFSLIEESTIQGTQLFYGLEISPQFDENQLRIEIDNKSIFEGNQTFRVYDQMITLDGKTLYLFRYEEGTRHLIEDLITSAKRDRKSIQTRKINQLYKLNIIGRQFSTGNILECEGRMIMMDFGFSPALQQGDFSYLYPPELDYVLKKQRINKSFHDFETYTSKLDSWLIGAFLYHLVKLNPIKKAEKNEQHIKAQTVRYENLGICEFIEQLLVFNPQARLSFLDIYQSSYIRKIEVHRPIQEYLDFYTSFENNKLLIENIKNRDYKIFDSFFRSSGIDNQTETIQGQLNLFSYLDGSSARTDQPQDPETSYPHVESITDHFFYNAFEIQTSNYKIFWYLINLEQYRCYILLNLADEINKNLANKNLDIELLASYILTKMCYLILVELIEKLHQNECPWADESGLWDSFKKGNQYNLLILALKSKRMELQITLKKVYSEGCQSYLNDTRLDDQLRISLKNDINTQFGYFKGLPSKDFLRNGFRQMTICIFKFLMNIVNLFEDLRSTQYSLILKLVCCHLINRIFSPDLLNYHFPTLKASDDQLLYPDDINNFLNHQNHQREHIKQINYLLDQYFYKKP